MMADIGLGEIENLAQFPSRRPLIFFKILNENRIFGHVFNVVLVLLVVKAVDGPLSRQDQSFVK